MNQINLAKVDLNLLKVFLSLCQEHNVTRAAQKLCVTQSAVSSSLKRLRHLYQDQLFERTQNGMEPTARALLLRPLIQDALAKVEQSLSDTITLDVRQQARTITIGLSDDFEMAIGPALVECIRREAPNFRIVFKQTHSGVVEQALNEHSIDIAITGGGINDPRIKHLSLGRAGYLCVYDKRHRSDDSAIRLEEFIAREHVLISYTGITGSVDDCLEELGLSRKIRVASTHFSALPFLLADTAAIATIPDFAAREIAKQGYFAVSPCPVAMREFAINIGWHYDAIRDSALMLVRDLATTTIKTKLGIT